MNLVLACTATHCEEMKINNAYGTKGSTGKIKRKLFQFETEIIAEYKCSFQMKDEKGGNHWTKCSLSNEDQTCSLSRKGKYDMVGTLQGTPDKTLSSWEVLITQATLSTG